MRTTFILNRALPSKKRISKRLKLDGKNITTEELIKLLIKEGHNVTYENCSTTAPATEYKGIRLGTAFWGMVVWAKNKEEEEKLFEILIEDRYLSHKCKMEVEKRKDKYIIKP